MTRRALWISALALMALVLAGCGVGGAENSTEDSVDSDSALVMSKANFGQRMAAARDDAGSAHVVMTMSMFGQELVTEGDLLISDDLATSASRMSTSIAGLSSLDMEIVQIGPVMYMNMGPMSGGKFVKIDVGDPDGPLGDLMSGMSGSNDAASQLSMFDEGVVDLEVVGDGGEIDGVKTTEYTVTIDFDQLELDFEGELTEEESALLPDELVVTVFVGEDDLIRRMTMDMDELMGGTMTMDFSRWGEPVDIQAPPADQVTEDLSFLGLDPEGLEALAS